MTIKTFPGSPATLGIHPVAGAAWSIQKVALGGSPTGGTFTLTYSGQTTAAIAWNATAYQVEQAVRALSNVGVGNVNVTGGPGPATAWFVNFTGSMDAQVVALMTINIASLTGGTPTGAVTSQQDGHARPHDNDYAFTDFTHHAGGWVQVIITPPTWNRWSSQVYTIRLVQNVAPPTGQLWPRGNASFNWPL